MREITKRTAAFSAALAAFALIGSGCHAKQKAGEIAGSATSAISSISESVAAPAQTPATETPGATAPSPGAAAPSPSPGAAAPSPTTMTGSNGAPFTVEGPVLAKYNSLTDSARKDLGAPKDNQQKTRDGGVYQQFDDGVIINKPQGESFVVWGKIRDKWNAMGGSQGKLGYPTSDEQTGPDGVKKSTFEHGTITWKPGDAEATYTYK